MRLSQGRLSWWPESGRDAAGRGHELASHELAVLLAGGDPRRARGGPAWRPLGRVARSSAEEASPE